MKKAQIRYAGMSTAVAAVLFGGLVTHAQTVTWDPSGSTPPVDGGGNWDTSSSQWYNAGTNTVGAWSNSNPDSAVFGTGSNPSATGAAINVSLNAPNITAQDIIFGTASGGGYYNLLDQEDGAETLTLAGNLIKSSAVGTSVIQLSSPMILTAGNHVVAINDTQGHVPELSVENAINGSGSITVNNAYNSSGYTPYGTFVLDVANGYTGGTNIVNGIVTSNITGALGTGTVTIGDDGALEFGGNGTPQAATINVTNPIVITRNTYTGTNYSDNPAAITSSNAGTAGAVVTLSGPFVVDTTNAQISANTSTIVIPNAITTGPDVTTGMLTVTGDFAGFVTLGGNNTALTGGIAITGTGGVELNASSLANIGGASATLDFNGSGTFHPVGGFITNFGTLNVNYPTFSGGIDVDPSETFTISENLGGVGNTTGSIGERGAGTLNLSGTDILGGTTFWDGVGPTTGPAGGVINVTGTLTLGALFLRSPVVNITGSITTTSGYSSFGDSSNGTPNGTPTGSPDNATVYLTGNGNLTTAAGNDFNLSDAANTGCTLYVENNATLNINGAFYMGKSPGATATIYQSGGTVTNQNGGGDAFDLGGLNGGGTGTYNMSGGALNIDGEMWVGNQGGGTGVFNQTSGNVSVGSWFVVGRQGGMGTYTMSGGTLTRTNTNGGSNNYIGETNSATSTMTVDDTAVANFETGQFWVGENGIGILNVGSLTDPVNAAPSFTVNNWFAIGRGNGAAASGTLNLYDGTVTQQGSNYMDIGGDGGSAVGVVNVYGGALSALNTWIGENSTDVGTLNMNGGSASLGNIELALGNTANGTINLNKGTLTAVTITAQNNGGTGTPELFLNGGTLTTTSGNVNNNFVGAKVTSVVSSGGAIINANGGYINYNSALTHDATLSGADGGLTITGTGTVQLGTSGSHSPINTYTGPTTVQGGTLIISTVGALPTGGNVVNSSAFVVSANSTGGNVSSTGTTTVGSGVAFTASGFVQGALVNNGSTQITGAGAIGGVTGTGTLTVGTGTSNNTVALTTNSGGSTQNGLVIDAGSALNINNNHMFITYGTGTDPIASVAGWLQSGYAGGAWNGAGINSSAAAANSASYGLGYADSADAGNPAGLSSGTIEIAYTLLGDANLDGVVNGTDFGILAANFNKGVTGWDKGDFFYANVVNATDFGVLAKNFNKGATGADVGEPAYDDPAILAFAAANGLLADVPEPASITLLAIGGMTILRRRRRGTMPRN